MKGGNAISSCSRGHLIADNDNTCGECIAFRRKHHRPSSHDRDADRPRVGRGRHLRRGPDLGTVIVRAVDVASRLAFAGVLLATLLVLTDCTPRLPSGPVSPPVAWTPLPALPADVLEARGRVVQQQAYELPLAGRDSPVGQAWQAVYKSVSGVDGGSREVSGVFFIPTGVAPDGGWPAVSLAHGTTGIGHDCGPSRQPDLQGYGWLINLLLRQKYAVALTDYEGLGQTGLHPYLEPRTAAYNVTDAVRALRQLSSDVSDRWVAVGYSQGGQAAWAVNELNDDYGTGLQLLGSVALAPAANVTGVADLVWSRSMTDVQRAIFPLFVIGLARHSPDLDVDAFLHGRSEYHEQQLGHCEPRGDRREIPTAAPLPWRSTVDRTRESNDLRPYSPNDIADLRNALQRVALPQRHLNQPLLVVTGTADGLVLADWVRAAVSASCALGGQIYYVEIPGADHNEVLSASVPVVADWMSGRFADLVAPSNCPV